jgi:hypothetical protein
MKVQEMAVWLALTPLLTGAGAFAQSEGSPGVGQAVVTVLPKHEGEVASSVANQDLSVQVNGKKAQVTKWAQFQSGDRMELVVLIDDSARSSLGSQMEDISHFVKALPPNIKAAVAYMQNGRAVFAAPLTADHDAVLKALHLPGGSSGTSSSPYFCLSDLAKNWPSTDASARREVVMVADGVDPYERRFDPEDPYVETAISDAVKARLVVNSIYWMSRGRADSTESANDAGQNLLFKVAEATGGKSFWQGMGNPVSFEPYFDELIRRFRNQYELGFVTPMKGKPEVETLKLKLSAPGDEVDAPKQVLVMPGAAAQN